MKIEPTAQEDDDDKSKRGRGLPPPESRLVEVVAERKVGGKECFITVYREDGRLILTTIDKSGKPTMSAVLTKAAAKKLGEVLVKG